MVDGNFERVDARVVGDDAIGELHVAVHERIECLGNLLFYQPAHLQHVATHRFQVGVKLLRNVFSHSFSYAAPDRTAWDCSMTIS